MQIDRSLVEIVRTFRAVYPGYCTLDFEHVIKRNDIIGTGRRLDNPMLLVTGYICKNCVKDLPKAAKR